MVTAAELNNITNNFTLYANSVCLLVGIIGLSLNCVLFTRRTFQNNPCALYFLASTFANLVIILINNPILIIRYKLDIDIQAIHILLCKILRYIFWTSRAISVWLIVLASFDRYLLSSPKVHIRLLSSIKNAKRLIFITTISLAIIYTHMLIFYTLEAENNTTSECTPQQGFYAVFTSFLHLILYSCLPILLMFTFGLLTLRHIHKQYRLIQPMIRINQPYRQSIKLNNQLLKMLFLQILIITLTTVPLCIQRIYDSLTSYIIKSNQRAAEERLFQQVTQGFSYLAHSSSFYCFTLAGSTFRKELKQLFKILKNICQRTKHS